MLECIQNNLVENVKKKSQVVIISANGPVFSSGHDLKELVWLFGKLTRTCPSYPALNHTLCNYF
jgi:enoyl-CoA hydratase/carnithine racemase